MPCNMSPRQVRLPSDLSAPRVAREFLRDDCCQGHPQEFVEKAQLLVSELVTNAVRHGAPPIDLQVRCAGDDTLQILVSDSDPGTPVAGDPGPDAEGGRGMMLVDLISEDWGLEDDPDDGKVVWFTLKV